MVRELLERRFGLTFSGLSGDFNVFFDISTYKSLVEVQASFDVAITALQVAYIRFVEVFWSIDYRYRVSWSAQSCLLSWVVEGW